MRILVLGGLGMLGHQVYVDLKNRFSQVFVCIRQPASNALKYGIFDPKHLIDNVDLLHQKTVEITLKNINPDLIINCAGITKVKMNSLSRSEMVEMNALFPQRLSEWCDQHSARLIHFSNDEVFQGRAQPYTEESSPDSNDLYGRSKSSGELLSPTTLILRSHFIGYELVNPTEILNRLIEKKHQTIKVSKDKIYSGVTTHFMSRMLAEWIHQGVPFNGLYQVASRPISEFDLVNLINDNLNLRLNIEVENSISYAGKNKILSNSKLLEKWPHKTPLWADMIAELAVEAREHNLLAAS
jgi:dTDP-4-dehydrorhamnose reductase